MVRRKAGREARRVAAPPLVKRRAADVTYVRRLYFCPAGCRTETRVPYRRYNPNTRNYAYYVYQIFWIRREKLQEMELRLERLVTRPPRVDIIYVT